MLDDIQIEHRLSSLEQDEKSVHRRLDNLEKLVDSVHIIALETKQMREDLNDIDERVNDIESKPAKRYEAVVAAIITGLVTGLIGVCLGMIF